MVVLKELRTLLGGWDSDWQAEANEDIREFLEGSVRPEDVEEAVTNALALKTVLTTDAWMTDPEIFEKVCLGLVMASISTNIWEACHPSIIASAYAAMRKYRSDVQIGPDVAAYIAACHVQYGLVVYPRLLKVWEPPLGAYPSFVLEYQTQKAKEIDEAVDHFVETEL